MGMPFFGGLETNVFPLVRTGGRFEGFPLMILGARVGLVLMLLCQGLTVVWRKGLPGRFRLLLIALRFP